MIAVTPGAAAFWLALAIILPIVRYYRARLRARRDAKRWAKQHMDRW